MAGGKRKVAQVKTKLEAKRTKIEEDIDDFLKDLTDRHHVNTNSDETKDVDTNKAEIIEFTINNTTIHVGKKYKNHILTGGVVVIQQVM
jgi:uncharacterized damage-inducible protein DinB